ncbi:MAG: hypothetical protein KJP00_02535 [Bacteroidia bacterium]|nr:hypothetical protein [Bacteroidia bacterium]
MIRYIKNKEINRLKWDQRVIDSGNSRMYALAGYLDSVTRSWDAIVLGKYEAILPIPIDRKWLLARSIFPPFVQQLGVIGTTDKDTIEDMINMARKHFRRFQHQLNHENGKVNIDGLNSAMRTNYELDLHDSYEVLRRSYDKHLLRNLERAAANDLEYHESEAFAILESFIRKFSNRQDPSPKHLDKIKAICDYKTELFRPSIYSVSINDERVAVALAPQFGNRITLLIPRSSDEGRQYNAMAFLIDQLIQQNAGKHRTLDFEGSMIPGVARFYKQFGAIDRPYFNIYK